MILLALDSSGTSASAALMDDYIVMAEFTVGDRKRKTHSETLMPMINNLFEVSGISPSNLDYIACTNGPGSFTGLRIGAATAKGLAFATGKPLIAVPTLDAMAYTVEGLYSNPTWVAPMMDARRGQAYSAFYYNGKRQTDYMAEPVEDLHKMLKDLAGNDQIIIIKDGCLRASSVGALALKMTASASNDFAIQYIRKPQAEREKEAKITIANMTAKHLDEVFEIENKSFAIPWSKNELRRDLEENKNSAYKVAIRGSGEVIGYAGLWHIVNEGQITNIAVAEAYRRTGVASRLVESLIALAKEREMIGLTLEVRESNAAAQALYKKYGFKPEGKRKSYYADTGEDAIIMWNYF